MLLNNVLIYLQYILQKRPQKFNLNFVLVLMVIVVTNEARVVRQMVHFFL